MIRHEGYPDGVGGLESALDKGPIGLLVPELPNATPDIVERQRLLAANFLTGSLSLLQGEADVQLREAQVPTMESLRTFFETTVHHLGRRTLWPGPPGSGKSMLAAVTAKSAGIGEPLDLDGGPLRGLVLVSRTTAREQVLETCNLVVPESRPMAFFPRDDPEVFGTESDLLVMSYPGFSAVSEAKLGRLASKLDLLVLDEVHRGLGRLTLSRLLRVMNKYVPTVFAISATPDFSEERSAARKLGIETIIPALSPREAVEAGVTNGVQLLALHSGQSFAMESNRPVLTDEDLDVLVDSEPRNELIVSLMADMARQGTQGLVQCIPGGGNRHAQWIAEMASAKEITDPQTGESRLLRVEAVGTYSPEESRKAIEAFKAGKLDALTFTRSLVESFDYSALRYIIAAAPTSSAVDMGQLVGRGARLGDERLTRIFYIFDRLTSGSRKVLQTPFHVFGADNFYQGEIIARQEQRSGGQTYLYRGVAAGSSQRKPVSTEREELAFLSPVVRQALEQLAIGTVLDEVLIVESNKTEAPPDYRLVSSLPVVSEELVTTSAVRLLLRKRVGDDGRPMFVVADNRAYASPEAAAYVESRYRQQHTSIIRPEIDTFLSDYGWPPLSLDALMTATTEAEVPYEVARTVTFTAEAARKMLLQLTATPFVDPDEEVHMTALAAQLGHKDSTRLMERLHKIEGWSDQYLLRRRGKDRLAYKIVGAMMVSGAINFLEVLAASSKNTRQRMGDRTAQEIVQAAQAEYRQYVWNTKARPTISPDAVHAFIESLSFKATRLANDSDVMLAASGRTAPGVPKRPRGRVTSPPPAPLDSSYRLSKYRKDWVKYANCRDADPELFTNESLRPKKAIEMCNACPVKGDCLLFTLRTTNSRNDPGIRGGLRQYERADAHLDRTAAIEWLESTRPPAGFKQDYDDGTRRA